MYNQGSYFFNSTDTNFTSTHQELINLIPLLEYALNSLQHYSADNENSKKILSEINNNIVNTIFSILMGISKLDIKNQEKIQVYQNLIHLLKQAQGNSNVVYFTSIINRVEKLITALEKSLPYEDKEFKGLLNGFNAFNSVNPAQSSRNSSSDTISDDEIKSMIGKFNSFQS